MIPNREWIRQWVEKRPGLSSQVDLERYFTQLRIAGNSIEVARIGMCSVPSGELLVRDPIRYLSNREELPYFVTSPVGIYPLEVAFTRTEDGDILYLAVRLRFNYRPAVHFVNFMFPRWKSRTKAAAKNNLLTTESAFLFD